MVKVIENMGIRATIDLTDLNNVKTSIDISQPIMVREYRDDFSVWHWDEEMANYLTELWVFVDDVIFEEKMRRRRERLLCAAS